MQSVTADVTANCSFSLLALTFRFSPKENHIVENELHHVDGLKFNACYSLSHFTWHPTLIHFFQFTCIFTS
jgi:hypothetical protein